MSYRPYLPEEAREEVEKLKKYYRKRERQKKERCEETGQEFNLSNMPWRNNSMQFDQGYIITQALKHNNLIQDD